MLFINNAEVAKVLTMEDTLRITEEGITEIGRGDAFGRPSTQSYTESASPDLCYRWKGSAGSSKSLQRFAIRLMSEMVSWPIRSGKRVEDKYCVKPGLFFGNMFLFSTENGEPLALINDGYLQHFFVGARAGLGAKYLARKDASVIGMLGSGGQAESHLIAFAAVRKIRKVKVYSPNREHREHFAREMGQKLGIEISPCAAAEDALRGVDILASCTNAREPVVNGSMIEPGMHLTLVSGEAVEFSPDVYPKIDVCLGGGTESQIVGTAVDDTQALPVYVAGNLKAKVREQKPKSNWEQFRGRFVSWPDLIAGKVQGRSNDSEVSASGLKVRGWSSINGMQYVAMASRVYDLVKEAGLGREVPTEWFLSDIRT